MKAKQRGPVPPVSMGPITEADFRKRESRAASTFEQHMALVRADPSLLDFYGSEANAEKWARRIALLQIECDAESRGKGTQRVEGARNAGRESAKAKALEPDWWPLIKDAVKTMRAAGRSDNDIANTLKGKAKRTARTVRERIVKELGQRPKK